MADIWTNGRMDGGSGGFRSVASDADSDDHLLRHDRPGGAG